MIHPGPKTANQDFDNAVHLPKIYATVTPLFSFALQELPSSVELLPPLALLNLSDTATATVSAQTTSDTPATMVPSLVLVFGCVAIVTRLNTMVRLYY